MKKVITMQIAHPSMAGATAYQANRQPQTNPSSATNNTQTLASDSVTLSSAATNIQTEVTIPYRPPESAQTQGSMPYRPPESAQIEGGPIYRPPE